MGQSKEQCQEHPKHRIQTYAHLRSPPPNIGAPSNTQAVRDVFGRPEVGRTAFPTLSSGGEPRLRYRTSLFNYLFSGGRPSVLRRISTVLGSSGRARMPDPPSGTVTFLFADIEDSTRLLHQLGDRYTTVIEEYHRLLREIFHQAGGFEEDPAGESLFVVFPHA